MVLSVEANGYSLRWKVTLPLNCNFTGKQCNIAVGSQVGQRKSRNVKPRGRAPDGGNYPVLYRLREVYKGEKGSNTFEHQGAALVLLSIKAVQQPLHRLAPPRRPNRLTCFAAANALS